MGGDFAKDVCSILRLLIIVASFKLNLNQHIALNLLPIAYCIMAIHVPIEDWIDLHTFSPKEIPSLLEDYLLECQKRGFREVRIIHGKGKGVQLRIVHSFLERSPLVESYRLAPLEAGGWGATIASLRPLTTSHSCG